MRKFNVKKFFASVMAVMTVATGAMGMSANAYETIKNESGDILVWEETEEVLPNLKLYSNKATNSYNTWINKGTKTILGYKNSKKIGKQDLTSYRYENLSEQKLSKATVKNYKYDSKKNKYIYGWKNSTDCYCRARVESKMGDVYEDSGRKYGQYSSTAMTTNPVVGICRTYCGNRAAD